MDVWQLVCSWVIGAHEGQAPEGLAFLSRPQQKVAGSYLVVLLKFQVAARLGSRPSLEDLAAVAVELQPGFDAVLPSGALLGTLETAFRMAIPATEVRGLPFLTAASVALGLMLDSPAEQLEALRPSLQAAVLR